LESTSKLTKSDLLVPSFLDPQAQVAALRKERFFVDRLDSGVLARPVHIEVFDCGVPHQLDGLVVEQRHELRAGAVFHAAGQDEASLGGLNFFLSRSQYQLPLVPSVHLFLVSGSLMYHGPTPSVVKMKSTTTFTWKG
jgi:hypothetical protein